MSDNLVKSIVPMPEYRRPIILKEWQERLGLMDWNIKLQDMCMPDDMALIDSAGCTVWVEPIKAAKIQILDPKYYGDRIVPFDWEKTLVHELLHLKLCLVSDGVGDLQARYMHQIIDDLAKAFINTKDTDKGKDQ